MMTQELTTKQKWSPIDERLAEIKDRKTNKQSPYQCDFDRYIDENFNK
jgi:hypothetical protein